MKRHFVFFAFFVACVATVCWGLVSCAKRPSRVEVLRAEKAAKDSTTYAHAVATAAYSDSLLPIRLQQADSLLTFFRYEKNEKAEDHGHYVHKMLVTSANTSRNFLQAYVADNRRLSVQSYYYGSGAHDQYGVRIADGDLYVEVEGSNYAFDVEGRHEILTVTDDDALRLLAFVAERETARLKVTSLGKRTVQYILSDKEKRALADTYALALVMRDIDHLERAIHTARMQMDKYEKKHRQ